MSKGTPFSDYLSEGLKKSSISLRRLCREAKTDPSFISKVMRGILPPPTDEKLIERIAEVLGLDPVTLILSTGTIPQSLRRDPETLKMLLQGNRPAPAKTAPVYKSPHLSEDLL